MSCFVCKKNVKCNKHHYRMYFYPRWRPGSSNPLATTLLLFHQECFDSTVGENYFDEMQALNLDTIYCASCRKLFGVLECFVKIVRTPDEGATMHFFLDMNCFVDAAGEDYKQYLKEPS